MPALAVHRLNDETIEVINTLTPLRWLAAETAFAVALVRPDLGELLLLQIDKLVTSGEMKDRKDIVQKEVTMARAKLAAAFPAQMLNAEILERLRAHEYRDEAAIAMGAIAFATNNAELYQEALKRARESTFFDHTLADIGLMAKDQSPLKEAISANIKNVKINPSYASMYAVKLFGHCAEGMWR